MKFTILAVLALGNQQSPIEKCVQLLTDLQEKVMKDGEAEQKQYETFAEWCEDEAVSTQYEIKDGKSKVASLSASIEKAGATISSTASKIDAISARVASNERDLQA